jgi:indolepyruvate ferredoxin oxidoreductase beta subunit
MTNIILTGVGGQGIVLASKLIAQAALKTGQKVRTAETIGMAQRGGSVLSHVRIGNNIHSPLIPLQTADLIIGFEPAEAVRSLPYLKKQGAVVVSQKAIKPITSSSKSSTYEEKSMLDYLQQTIERLFIIDGEAICLACGSAKVLNVALLGAAAASGTLGLNISELQEVLKNFLPEKLIAMNLKALELGARIVTKGNGLK